MGTIKKAFNHYAAIVIDVIPCIIVASLLGAIIQIFTQLPLATGKPLAEHVPLISQWCSFLSVVSECGILMLPVYVTWATVRHFHGTELYSLFVGLAMTPGSLISGMDWENAVAQGTAEYWTFALQQVPKAGFQGQMLVGILGGICLVYLERFFSRRIPKALYLFFVPFLSIVPTVILVYTVIGPATAWVENGLTAIFTFLLSQPSLKNWGGLILGLCQLPMMLFGVHLALVPVNLQMIQSGEGSPVWPIMVISVLSCGAAALAASLLARDQEGREGAVITLGLGTVEPALFGVCVKNRYALVCAVLSAGLGGFLCRALGCYSTIFGLNGLFSFLSVPMALWGRYALAMAVSVTCSFLSATACLRLVREKRRKDI